MTRSHTFSRAGFVHLWPVKIPWFSMTFSMTFWKTLWPKLSNSSPAVVSKQSFIQLRLNLSFGLASWFFNFGSHCLSFIESILIFHDFPWPTPKFQDFPGLEIEIVKFHDFPGFPWPYEPCRASRQLQVLSLKFVGSLFVVGLWFYKTRMKNKKQIQTKTSKQMQQEVLSKHLKMNNS